MSALSHFPCEILKEIMYYAYVYIPKSEGYNKPQIDLEAISLPVLASHVCRSWRRTLLSDSTIWTCLSIPDMKRDMIMELIQRSGSSLLSVYVKLKLSGNRELKVYGDISHVLSTIFQQIHRFKVLHLQIDTNLRYPSCDLLEELVLQVLSFIQRPAPQLRTFCFLNSDLPIGRIFLNTLFSRDAPNLKNIHHMPSHDFLELNCPLFHNLSELYLSLPECFTPKFRHFLNLLEVSPRLRLLFVDLGWKEVPFETSCCMVDLPCLQRLVLIAHITIKIVELILECVKLPSTTKWDIGAHFLSEPEESPTLDCLVYQAHFTSLDITLTYHGPIYLLLKEQNGFGPFYTNQFNDSCLEYSYDGPSVLLEFWDSLQPIIVSSAITHIKFAYQVCMPPSDRACTVLSAILRSVDNLECLTIEHKPEPLLAIDGRTSISACLSVLVPNPERVAAFEYAGITPSTKEPTQDPVLDFIPVDSEDDDSGGLMTSTSEGTSDFSWSHRRSIIAYAFPCPRLCKLIVEMDSLLDMVNAVMFCVLYSRYREEGYPLQIFVSCPGTEKGVESILQGKNNGIHVSSNPLK